ncbi:MAG: VCBS repeat-containing protein [Desulfobacterales bacterium]
MERKVKLISKTRFLGALLATSLALHGCGGGDDADWLFPLWVTTDVLVADIDGNGHADILTLAQYATGMEQREGRLVVRLQTAPGVYAPAQTYLVGIYPWKMALGDIDGDDAADLVITDFGFTASVSATDQSVWMLLQDPGKPGTFLPPQRLPLDPHAPYDVAIGDLSGDGVPDIVLADSLDGQSGATLLIQDAANRGTFLAPSAIPLPGRTGHVALGDIDGNGRDDLAFRVLISTTNYVPTTELGIVYQLTGGVLEPAMMLSRQTGLNTHMLELTDYNVDGATDVVELFTGSDSNYRNKVTTLLQDPVGTFTPVDTALDAGQGVEDGVMADLDGDARPDFATFRAGENSTLDIFIQDGSGGFALSVEIPLPDMCTRLAAGDLDGDRLTDLVILCSENKVVLVLQSAAAPGTFLAPRIVD